MAPFFIALITSIAAFSLHADIGDESEITPLPKADEKEIASIDDFYSEDLEVDGPFDRAAPLEPIIPPDFSQSSEELTVNLKNPSFTHGVISTQEGGIVSAPGIRIQAQKIEYVNKIENGIRLQKITAEGDLLLEYLGRAFVGSRLEYDFVSRSGMLWDGKTFVDIWFLGGDRIELKEDGTFYIHNAYVTTCESQENSWEINARHVKITKEQLLSANNIRFNFFHVPLLWLPAFKSNLKMFSDPPIRYKVVWDKGLGPRVTMRYRIFSWQDLSLFFRLDYRIQRGLGGALESEYFSPDKRTTFVTRSYGAHDKSFPDEKGPHRYRLQGLYHTSSLDGKTSAHFTYDKLSDPRMVGDFKSEDFEINTQRRTRLLVAHEFNEAFLNLSVQPRLNRFQSIDQELPLITVGIRPFELGNSGIISANIFNGGYLDYVFANDLRHEFRKLDLSSSTRAMRLETLNRLYRPFRFGHLTFTPSIGAIGIFYNNNPHHDAVGQGIFTYGFNAQTELSRSYKSMIHTLEPYISYLGLTQPTIRTNNHFIFDINDGYFQFNQVRVGVRNYLFHYKQSCFLPSITSDLWTYGYFGHRGFAQTFPKSYFSLGLSRPSFSVNGGVAWNNEEDLWDYANVLAQWTLNEDIAVSLEYRHRSRFDWRKADHESFILDVARPIDELLHSPISDGRNTVLSRLFVRLAPKLTCQIQTRNGWGRRNEPSYNAGRFDLFYMLTGSWRLRLSYERLPNDNRFSGTIQIVK